MHARYLNIPAPKEGAVDWLLPDNQTAADRYRQAAIPGQRYVGLDELKRASVKVHLVAKQIST
ncbi:hypothetical protein DIR46_15715 [Massilia oculi]|uniref:Uncharacterized protein n=1 Tax=Massilia oculi TaxID=945844 RepID=A0A2S2DK74_9BURK|nr:hypothetical protein DIR46_15715 [Massilia oculi]